MKNILYMADGADGGAQSPPAETQTQEADATPKQVSAFKVTIDKQKQVIIELGKQIGGLKDQLTAAQTAHAKTGQDAQTTIDALNDKIQTLNATIATQKATIENLTAAKAEADADEKLILGKMGLGLTRDQATAVVKRQKAHDDSPLAKQHARNNDKAAKRKADAEKQNDEP